MVSRPQNPQPPQNGNNISFFDKNSCILSELDNLSKIMAVGEVSEVSSPTNLVKETG
jgi:hypothetical protein